MIWYTQNIFGEYYENYSIISSNILKDKVHKHLKVYTYIYTENQYTQWEITCE